MTQKRTLTSKLLMGLGASAFGQLITIISQVVQIPLFLRGYGVELTGEWLILSAVPTYIALSDVGFSNVAVNEMSIAMSGGQKGRALEITHSLCRFIALVAATMGIIVVVLGLTVNWAAVLSLKHVSAVDGGRVLLLLSLGAVVFLSAGIFYGTYRASQKGPRIFMLVNLSRLAELIGLAAATWLKIGFVGISATLLVVRVLAFGLIWLDSRRSCPELPLGVKFGQWREMRQMLRPAVAFMAFPLGNALYFQGTAFVVNVALGAAAVVAYSACRTFSRSAPLVLTTVRQSLWMEYPHLAAQAQWGKLRLLQRIAGGVAWAVMLLALAITLPLGSWLIHIWTLGKVNLSSWLICLFIVVAGLNSFWNVTSTLLIALNRHEGLAKRYLLWVAMALLASYLGATYGGGLGAVGCGLLAAEIPLCVYVAINVSRMAGDSPSAFIRDVIAFQSLKTNSSKLLSWFKKTKANDYVR
jgi:O-antigen/teichoic acid export membrane protein